MVYIGVKDLREKKMRKAEIVTQVVNELNRAADEIINGQSLGGFK